MVLPDVTEDDKKALQLSALFDEAWYCAEYPDVPLSGMDAAEHYLWIGAKLGRRPSIDAERGALPAAPQGRPEISGVLRNGQAWPPAPIGDYWPSQTLRDLVIDSYGDDAIGLYWYLCSVMAAWRDDQTGFADSSAEVGLVMGRLQDLARAHKRSEQPEATIIVPVYNNILDTLLCLVTVLETAGERSFEVIVADDGSSDATARLVPQIGGNVVYYRQPENLGFLRNCNTSVQRGKGRYVVLLNNDTLVMPGWLDKLLAPFAADPSVGLTGSKLLNWDGTLQEAGGIFWEDGSAWNFGRGSDARAPQFCYAKEVDYCSGASIAMPRDLWDELAGFDEYYLPAYCEDSDLAFRVRAAGRRTLFTPFSEVIHHEGRSHGRDTSSGVKAYQVTNQAKLVERWGEVLRRDHYPNAQNVLRARDRSRYKKHVLIIDHYVPQWDQDAGSRTLYQYIKLYQKLDFHVTFWPDNLWYDPVYAPQLQEMGVEVIHGAAFRDGFEAFMADRVGLYDTVFLSRPHVAEKYLRAIRQFTDARVLYYGHDLHFRRMEAQLKLTGEGDLASIAATREHELSVCRECDVIFYPDPDEVVAVRSAVGGSRRFEANPVFVYEAEDLAQARAKLTRIADNTSRQLLFVGGFSHTPNVEGIIWFAKEVMPILRSKLPGVRLKVAGSKPPQSVKDLAGQDLDVLGFVSDEELERLYGEAALAVAPLRFGAGVKGKVIEAMASAVPMATTSIGGQGISAGEQALFLGDSPQALADTIALAITDRAAATCRATAALDFIERHYSSEALGKLLLEVSLY